MYASCVYENVYQEAVGGNRAEVVISTREQAYSECGVVSELVQNKEIRERRLNLQARVLSRRQMSRSSVESTSIS